MFILNIITLFLVLFGDIIAIKTDIEQDEENGANFLKLIEQPNIDWYNRIALANWDYNTNITKENAEHKKRISSEFALYKKLQLAEASKFKWRQYSNKDLKRQFKLHLQLGDTILSEEKYNRLQDIKNEMKTNYATGKICDYTNRQKCDLELETDVNEIFAKSRNAKELQHVWEQWRNVAGAPIRELFTEYVQLKNEGAQLNNYTNTAEMWLAEYDSDDFENQLSNILNELKPLYMQLHAYVRYKLRRHYSSEVVSERGPIPAHLLGNNWAQKWPIEDIVKPYPEANSADITPKLLAQNYTPRKLFELANDFFKSINLTGVPDSFWEKSMLKKPADGRKVVCHASAADLGKDSDVRIKMCTQINAKNYQTVHHEMGHVQYYLQYKHLPLIYRRGANPGFHEAIGDTIAMSATTAKHFRRIGLLHHKINDHNMHKEAINLLMAKALDKIPSVFYTYLLDTYRLSVFRNETTPDNYNCKYWKLREEIQGLEPPVDRSENDFDPGAKYHISADVEYYRYCVSYIIQFQFQQALCKIAGEYIPGDNSKKLMNCDIYQHVEAGNALGNMLKLGRSKSWTQALKELTGETQMKASGILDYFQPLYDWLVVENEKNGVYIGWEPTKKRCSSSAT